MKVKTAAAAMLCAAALMIAPADMISGEQQTQTAQVEPQTHKVTLSDREAAQEVLEPQTEKYTVTAYCGCKTCCSKWSSVPAIGAGNVPLYEGTHCAAPLPFGTVVEIEGLGRYEVQDRTAKWVAEKYNGKIIDIYFSDHESALKFGKQELEVRIIGNES